MIHHTSADLTTFALNATVPVYDPRDGIPNHILLNAVRWNAEKAEIAYRNSQICYRTGNYNSADVWFRERSRLNANANEILDYLERRNSGANQ